MTNNAQRQLFTEALGGDLGDTVRRIPDGGVQMFRSAATTYDDGGKGWVQYDTAWRSGACGTWTVGSYKGFIADGQITAVQKKTVAREICFFDALYYCGFAETARLASGQILCEARLPGVMHMDTHYKDAAAQAGQPLDAGGLPHPAAGGHVLTDGLFDKQQLDIAAQTAKTPLAPALSNAPHMREHSVKNILGNVDVTAPSMDVAAIHGHMAPRERKERLAALLVKVKGFSSCLWVGISPLDMVRALATDWNETRKFDEPGFVGFTIIGTGICAGAGAAAGVVLGVGGMIIGASADLVGAGLLACTAVGAAVVPSIPFISRPMEKWVDSRRKKWMRKLDKEIAAMPESALKQALHEFHVTSEANAEFLKAAELIEVTQLKKTRYVTQAFNYIARGANILGLSEIEKSHLQRMALDGKFPDPDHFKKDIASRFEAVSALLDSAETSHLLDLVKYTSDVGRTVKAPVAAIEDSRGRDTHIRMPVRLK